jgi:hypothetical protein
MMNYSINKLSPFRDSTLRVSSKILALPANIRLGLE